MAAIALNTLVRPWVKGQKITEPGIYSGVPMEEYHGDLCDGPSISSSIIRKVEDKSPRHAWRDYYGNPNRKPPEEKAHFTLGRAIHHLAGGEAQFAKFFAVRPPKWDSWRAADAKNWRKEQTMLGMGVLTPDDVDTIQGVADSLNEHPTIQAGILKGLVEMTVVYRDAATGLWVKTRPDVIPLDSAMIVDLKTTADASRPKVIKSTTEFGYHIQLAMIDEALWQVAGWKAEEHVLVYVEKTDPWCINIKPLEDEFIGWGRGQFRRGIETFAKCLREGHFPGYADDQEAITAADWLRKRLQEQEKGHVLPSGERGPRNPKGIRAAVEEEAV